MKRELALFAGAGGGILGGQILGWETVCAVENDPYAASVLCARQNDGLLPPFPIWDDVCSFNGKPWAGIVDVVSGGFPCTDISAAGKGAGIEGKESGLWSEMARIIGQVRPREVFVENSPMLTSRGLATVLGDLAALGFDADWGVVGAHHARAPHKRDRIWVLARHPDRNPELRGELRNATDPNGPGLRDKPGRPEPTRPGAAEPFNNCETMADPKRLRGQQYERAKLRRTRAKNAGCGDHSRRKAADSWWESEPRVGRLAPWGGPSGGPP